GTLAGGVAHEINNPLTYLLLHLGQAQRLAERLGGAPEASDLVHLGHLLAQAMDGAQRIRQITRGIRVFSRADDAPLEAFDVRGPLGAALSLISNEMRHRALLV